MLASTVRAGWPFPPDPKHETECWQAQSTLVGILAGVVGGLLLILALVAYKACAARRPKVCL